MQHEKRHEVINLGHVNISLVVPTDQHLRGREEEENSVSADRQHYRMKFTNILTYILNTETTRIRAVVLIPVSSNALRLFF